MPRKLKIAAAGARRPASGQQACGHAASAPPANEPAAVDGTASDRPVRERIIAAAFAALRTRGFGAVTTNEIATLAKVSKRELYACFEDKQELLIAGIAEHARRIRPPSDLSAPDSSEALLKALTAFGTATLRGVCDPGVLAIYRLAIGEAERAPEIAKTLDQVGREANRTALATFLAGAAKNGLIAGGDPAAMAETFSALLWGDMLIRVLLKVASPPRAAEIERRAAAAARTLLVIYR
jgi:AcrR family transcriptional regulator